MPKKDIIKIDSNEILKVAELLQSFNLPTLDIEIAPIHFYEIKEGSELIGVGGIEIYGQNAILRSLAIHKAYHNKGYGKLVTSFLEQTAQKNGIEKLFLLTTTAEIFFKKNGYKLIARDKCPPEILSSGEFSRLCPGSAILWSKAYDFQIGYIT